MPVAFFIMPSALRNLFPILQNILKCALPGSSFYSAFFGMHDISLKNQKCYCVSISEQYIASYLWIRNIKAFSFLFTFGTSYLIHSINTCKCYHWTESEGVLLVDVNKNILSAEYWCTMVLKFGNARREIIIKMCTKIMQLNLLISLVWCVIFGWMNTRNFDCTNFACYLFLLMYCYLCVPASC